MGEGSGGGVPPEAEENGAHAQERKANCSLQHAKITKRSTNVDCGRWTYCQLRNTGGADIFKKLDFHYSEKKNHYSEICILMNVDFLIITKNLGGLAAMRMTRR